jgi:hypothetical protein
MKTARVILRIEPALKVAGERAAASEHRSLSGLIEMLLTDYCKPGYGFVTVTLRCGAQGSENGGQHYRRYWRQDVAARRTTATQENSDPRSKRIPRDTPEMILRARSQDSAASVAA